MDTAVDNTTPITTSSLTPGFDAQGNATTPIDSLKEVEKSPMMEGDAPQKLQRPKKVKQPSPPLTDDEKEIDPVALKLESALKRSIADRTGNQQLKEEAAREQSRADKLGARAGLTKQQHERAKKEAEQLRADAAVKQSQADRTGDAALKKEAAAQQHLADKLIANANKALLAFEKAEKAAQGIVDSPSLNGGVTQQQEEEDSSDSPKTLKVGASAKQSAADRSGDESMKRAAAKEQSRADKARMQALRDSASGSDIRLTKSAGLPMSKQKSSSNVSLPNLPRMDESSSPALITVTDVDSALSPALVQSAPVSPMSRQKSANDVSMRRSFNDLKSMPRAKSGNDIALSAKVSQWTGTAAAANGQPAASPNAAWSPQTKNWTAPSSNLKWSTNSPHTHHVKFASSSPTQPQANLTASPGLALKWPNSKMPSPQITVSPLSNSSSLASDKKVGPASPSRSDALQWRQSGDVAAAGPTSPQRRSPPQQRNNNNKKQQQQNSKKVDAATNTDFVEGVEDMTSVATTAIAAM